MTTRVPRAAPEVVWNPDGVDQEADGIDQETGAPNAARNSSGSLVEISQ